MRKTQIAAIILMMVLLILSACASSTLTPAPQATDQLSADELSRSLFRDDISYAQRQSIWANYVGKQVKWESSFIEKAIYRDRKTGEEETIALFEPDIIVRVALNENNMSTLSQIQKGDNVVYLGTLDSYLYDFKLVLGDYGFSMEAVNEMANDYYERGMTWAETVANHGGNLTELTNRSGADLTSIRNITLKDGEIVSFERPS